MVSVKTSTGLPLTMWLWYDWQAAAVADDDGIIRDQAVWDGFFDQRALD